MLDFIILGLLGVCAVGLVFCAYMLFRNQAVFNYRMKVLHEAGIDGYDKLSSYDVMFNKFWVWPLSKFKEQ